MGGGGGKFRRVQPAPQLVACPSRSYVGGKGHGCLVYKYTWFIWCCTAWCNTPIPSCCCSIVAFKHLNQRLLQNSSLFNSKELMSSEILVVAAERSRRAVPECCFRDLKHKIRAVFSPGQLSGMLYL